MRVPHGVPGRPALLLGVSLMLAGALIPHLPVVLSVNLLAIGALALYDAFAGLHRRLRHLQDRLGQALTDPLTGLPVRRIADETITAASPAALLTAAFVDVNGLHDINHGPGGHTTGDRCLAEVARQLRAAAVAGDTVARLGGDEFVLLTARRPQDLADRLATLFPTRVPAGGSVLTVDVSIGICQEPGGDPHQILGCSSLAMLTAKSRRRRIVFYDAARDGLPPPRGVRPAVRHRDRDRHSDR